MHEHHDEFGGLQRDLLATGSAINRRQALRAAAALGISAAGLQLLGCSDSTGTDDDDDDDDGNPSCSLIPNETAGPFPVEG